jgi:uncharacterized protein YndB with AHSA1/START domain
VTSIDDVARSQRESISLEFELLHGPRKVWRALTDPALLSEWLLPIVELELTPGSSFTFTTQRQPGLDGIVNGRLLEIDAERMLRWQWVAGGIDTVVTFTLTPTPTGTRLGVEQSGFEPGQTRNVNGARYGWTMMGGKLIDLLARIP